MARTTSPRFSISYVNTATRDEPADFPADMKRLVDAFELLTPMWAVGTAAARPAASKSGRFYFATDTQVLSYDTGSAWVTIGPMLTQLVPTGAMLEFGGTAAPAGFLLADGTSYTVASQPALHGVIGYAYGGSGLNFNVPNTKGKALVGRDAAQTEFDTVGEAGGVKTHALSIAELAAHGHTVNSHNHGGGNHSHGGATGGRNVGHVHNIGLASGITGTGLTATSPQYNSNALIRHDAGGGSIYNRSSDGENTDHVHGINAEANISSESPGTNNAGSGTAHNNLQPYLVVNHIIKT